ncbi:MAG TPA: Na+/H+ antiporter [Ktedonobacterales bacterium]|jgi:CPA1 family monovalent cation:H+ antiporter|nr:Na+/H+ antiporter [Ktedonobacterales bacterium]
MVYTVVVAVFTLLVAVVMLASLATRLRVPYAILLVLGGLVLGFVPGLPTVTLDPALVLFLFLPPLIYSSAWFTPWRDFHADLRAILLLAVGLVLTCTTLVAVVAHAALGLAWPVAFLLGALVSPTDAVAASAIMQRLGVARRVVTIVEGESMVNDATGLVIYRFAVAAVVTGGFSLWQASWQFVVVSAGGVLIGLLIAWPVAWLHRRLDDAPREITLTLLTPFAAYLLADALGASGVLAVLSAGLYLSRQSSTFFSPNTRLQADAVWTVLVFLFNGLVFILLGLQLHGLLGGLTRPSAAELVGAVTLVSAVVIAARLAWVAVATSVQRLLAHYSLITYRWGGWRNATLVGWSGMRGAVSLAAALALPLALPSGTPFPARSQLIAVTFGVILVTLVGQGLSLPPLIRALGVRPDGQAEQDLLFARRALTEAALARLEELAGTDDIPQTVVADQRAHLEQQLDRLAIPTDDSGDRKDGSGGERQAGTWVAARRLRREVISAQRFTLITLRNQGKIADEVVRRLERDLDLEEQHDEQHASG